MWHCLPLALLSRKWLGEDQTIGSSGSAAHFVLYSERPQRHPSTTGLTESVQSVQSQGKGTSFWEGAYIYSFRSPARKSPWSLCFPCLTSDARKVGETWDSFPETTRVMGHAQVWNQPRGHTRVGQIRDESVSSIITKSRIGRRGFGSIATWDLLMLHL